VQPTKKNSGLKSPMEEMEGGAVRVMAGRLRAPRDRPPRVGTVHAEVLTNREVSP